MKELIMNIPINEAGNSEPIKVRRRNQGSSTGAFETANVNLPKELLQKINGIVVSSKLSRSLVISQLIADGFKHREQK